MREFGSIENLLKVLINCQKNFRNVFLVMFLSGAINGRVFKKPSAILEKTRSFIPNKALRLEFCSFFLIDL